ncbi:hypothetical protein GGD81_003321 [Rhodobium orientis]|nr:hypothetical protein [Rhodobium orientis]
MHPTCIETNWRRTPRLLRIVSENEAAARAFARLRGARE